MPDIPSSPYGFVGLLIKAASDMLQVKGGIEFLRKPAIDDKEVVSFHRRMRVDGLEKFDRRTVFSAVKFYLNSDHMERDMPAGVLVIFVETEYLPKLLWTLEYPRIDEDDEVSMLDGCGTLANLIAGHFVKELASQGFAYLQMSHFESHINTALNGIAFASDQTRKHEISFFIQGQKRIVAELVMGHVPRQ